MAITELPPQQIDEATWRLRWTSDVTPPVTFRVYQDGRKIAESISGDGTGELVVAIPPGEQADIEILDHATQRARLAYPGRLTLNWLRVDSASYYRIDELVDAVWTERTQVPESGQGAYRWQSRFLEDETTHQFRVTAVGSNGNESTALSFSCDMVRAPSVPAVTYTYNAGDGTVSIGAG